MKTHSDEIKMNSKKEKIWMLLTQPSSVTYATCKFYNLSNNVQGIPLEMTWDEKQKQLYVHVDTRKRSFWKKGTPIQVFVNYIAKGEVFLKDFYVTPFENPWIPTTTEKDMPTLDGKNLDSILNEAEDEIRLRLLSNGFSAGSVLDKPYLDECHKCCAISLAYLYASAKNGSKEEKEYEKWDKEYKKNLTGLLEEQKRVTKHKILTSSVKMVISEEIANHEYKLKILHAVEARVCKLTETEKQAVLDYNYENLKHLTEKCDITTKKG